MLSAKVYPLHRTTNLYVFVTHMGEMCMMRVVYPLSTTSRGSKENECLKARVYKELKA